MWVSQHPRNMPWLPKMSLPAAAALSLTSPTSPLASPGGTADLGSWPLAGESVAEPLRYYHNVTSNTLTLLEIMSEAGVNQVSDPLRLPRTKQAATHACCLPHSACCHSTCSAAHPTHHYHHDATHAQDCPVSSPLLILTSPQLHARTSLPALSSVSAQGLTFTALSLP